MSTRKVVITTEHRGVFFGTLVELDREQRTVILADARNCLKWGAEVRGFLGLAAVGPIGRSRVGPAVPRIELAKVTSVTDCTEAAITAWEAGPWK